MTAAEILNLFFPYTTNPHGNKDYREISPEGYELILILHRELKKEEVGY